MQFELNLIITPEQEKDKALVLNKLKSALKEKAGHLEDGQDIKDAEFVFVKKSIDARHGRPKIFLRYKAFVGEKAQDEAKKEFSWKKADGAKKILVVGSGPAGLFCSLRLLEEGIQPVIIERGKDTSSRKRDIALISTRGIVDGNSNYCFGEGGAGTFSDGKLYTRSNKRGDISSILRLFNYFGADEKILTDAHPHIGTNRLPQIVNAMREKILSLGGEFYFNTRVTNFIIEESGAKKTVRGVCAVDTQTGEEKKFFADATILCTGHSANDIYECLFNAAPECLEAKTFAVGVRAEHPRALIDKIQYHSDTASEKLGAAEYRLTSQVDGRGVYSFCMCPGGFVVPSATGPKEIVVNGMSSAQRSSLWSNAAIVVETRPEDLDALIARLEKGIEKFERASWSDEETERLFLMQKKCASLKGLYFRLLLERLTFLNGNGQKAPAQMMSDFLNGRESKALIKSSYTPGLTPSRLDEWLPQEISGRLKKGLLEFNKKMHGYTSDQGILIASETRTSTPVRILRNKETMQCECIDLLFPCGEGSGYSGGIVSSAMDGVSAAQAAIKALS